MSVEAITPRVLQAIVGQYERTIDSLNARLGDMAASLVITSDENGDLRERVKTLEEKQAKKAARAEKKTPK